MEYDVYCGHEFAYATEEDAIAAVTKLAKGKAVTVNRYADGEVEVKWEHAKPTGKWEHWTVYSISRVPIWGTE